MSSRKINVLGFDIPVRKVNMQAVVLTVILVMVAAIPLLSGTDALKNVGKTLLFELTGCLLLALMVSQVSFTGEALQSLKQRLLIGPTIPVVLLIVCSTISYAFAPYENFARAELFRIFFCGLIYATIGLYIRGIGRLQLLVDVLLVVGAIVSVISLIDAGNNVKSLAVTGTFGTHETLGSFLLLILPIALPIALTDLGEQKRQLFAQGVTLLMAAALLMAHTRSAWLGSACGLSALALLYWRFPVETRSSLSDSQRRVLQIGPAIILAAAIALFVLTSAQNSGIFERANTLTHLNADQSALVRRQMLVGAEHMFLQKPIFGWGIGSYPMLSFRFTHYGDAPADIMRHGLTLRNNAHCFYLQFAAEQGIVGLAIYLSVIAIFLLSSLRALKTLNRGLRKIVVIGCVSATVGQCVDAFISPTYNLPTISWFQFLILGMGVLAARGLDFSAPEYTSSDHVVRKRRKLAADVP